MRISDWSSDVCSSDLSHCSPWCVAASATAGRCCDQSVPDPDQVDPPGAIMRPAVLEFARDVAGHLPIAEPLVELGARAAEGQEGIADLRGIFGAAEHIGCDIQEGLGVDRIEDIQDRKSTRLTSSH